MIHAAHKEDAQKSERTKVKDTIKSFTYGNVSLQDSLWKRQRDYVIELYLSLSNGDILKSSMRRAGIDSNYNGLPGWGGTLGQMLGSYAKLYCVTGDYRLKAKAVSLFEELAALADEHPELYHQGPIVTTK